jgi:hypothetical protein
MLANDTPAQGPNWITDYPRPLEGGCGPPNELHRTEIQQTSTRVGHAQGPTQRVFWQIMNRGQQDHTQPSLSGSG